MATAELPNRSLFKAPEVCEIAQVQPYVLRSWEAEFPDLGVVRGAAGRVYRRHDVERVLRLKHLLFVEGLTLAGARRRLEEERAPLPALEEDVAPAAAAPRGASRAQTDVILRQQLAAIQQELRSLLQLLNNRRAEQGSFELHAPPAASPAKVAGKGTRIAKSSKSSARRRR